MQNKQIKKKEVAITNWERKKQITDVRSIWMRSKLEEKKSQNPNKQIKQIRKRETMIRWDEIGPCGRSNKDQTRKAEETASKSETTEEDHVKLKIVKEKEE